MNQLRAHLRRLPSQDVAEAAGVTSAPQLAVYKGGKSAGSPLLPQYRTLEETEAVLLRHVQRSQPAAVKK